MIVLHANPNNKEVALLFDDGPNPYVTPKLLKLLSDLGIPANFFLIGMRAEQSPNLVKQIISAGHEIGNHTYTHKRLSLLLKEKGKQAVIDEVLKGQQAIKTASGQKAQITFLRPPYLDWSNDIAKIIRPLYGDNIIMSSLAVGDWDWGVDHVWNKDDVVAIHDQAERIVKGWNHLVDNGTLLGFHDSSEHNLTGNKQYSTWMNRALPTLEAIPQIIDLLLDKGFEIKRLSEMSLVKQAYVK